MAERGALSSPRRHGSARSCGRGGGKRRSHGRWKRPQTQGPQRVRLGPASGNPAALRIAALAAQRGRNTEKLATALVDAKRKTRREGKRSACPTSHRLFLPLAPFSCQLFLARNRIHPPAPGLAAPGPLASPGCQASVEDALPSPLLLPYQLAPSGTRTADNTLQHSSHPRPSHFLHQRGSPPGSGEEDVPRQERDTAQTYSQGRRVSPERALPLRALESPRPPV